MSAACYVIIRPHVHIAHAAHAAAIPPPPPIALLVLRQLGDHRLGGQQQRSRPRPRSAARSASPWSDRRTPISTRSPYSPVCGVEAVVALALDDLVDDDRRLVAGVGDDLPHRLFERAQHDLDAGVLIVSCRPSGP